MDKILGKDPNAYFFKLAQSGSKLPIDFNMESIKDPNLIPLRDTSILRQIHKVVVKLNIPPIFSQSKKKPK